MPDKTIKIQRNGVMAAALAELQQEKVKEATAKLKQLYRRKDEATKILRNIEREIEDYLQELEIADADVG